MEWPRRERSPARSPVRSSTAPTQFEIERLLTEQTELWARHDQRCYDRKTDQRHLDEQQRRDDEFVRTMSVARFEYEQRKCRTKALQARLERDVQFLQASLEDVKRREKLLDDAFEAFVTELRIKHKQPAPSA
ncbi:TPA: hypothetical protein N0F65_000294 [Lagenidium giganteum]|uniref:DUF4200 domain-containing protein n=1 Tax=Lagenidium giganteum TaxID=4803 RepID=A0AAV2Z5T4_9STRA|nr:TPA: hypothetical protein N0F65_000294 [Lagenidium giganteum]